VIFFRFKGEHPETAGKILLDLIKTKEFLLENNFTVIEKDNLRQRKY
jgi:hypothetical protein